jgi:hypothetical protein
MGHLPLSSVEYQAKAAELRRVAKDFVSVAARRRAALIVEELERQACVAEGGVSAEDGVLHLDN